MVYENYQVSAIFFFYPTNLNIFTFYYHFKKNATIQGIIFCLLSQIPFTRIYCVPLHISYNI